MYVHDILNWNPCFYILSSFLTIIESIPGKIQIITPYQRICLFIKKKINTYARVQMIINIQMYCKWPTTIVFIHFCWTYLTELSILLNPLLPSRRILDKLKFCNGSVNFEITRFIFNCKLGAVMVMIIWSLDMQSVPITTKVVSWNLVPWEVCSLQHYVIKFVSDLRQVVVFSGYSEFLHQ